MTDLVFDYPPEACLIGRIWNPEASGPSVVTVREGLVVDITARAAPTVCDICEMDDPVAYVREAEGRPVAPLEALIKAPADDPTRPRLLAPCDLQAIKACGVTFATSMVERVIEERAGGDPALAEAIRARIAAAIGASLRAIRPGTPEATAAKAALQAEGLWSQYLEVAIGPDAEVFTKAPVLSAVGYGAAVGLHPASRWNNPEPEIVLAVSSRGRIVGATLGNDVNLRDFEGRSALLLSKAKDNNASCAIGPFIRLFDATWNLEAVRGLELRLRVEGPEGFTLEASASMAGISRTPEELVAQTIGRHHQYPDGVMLFLGTPFAPTADRDAAGGGFTHRVGDVVTISAPGLGALRNVVQLSTECAEWTFGIRALMANLAARELL